MKLIKITGIAAIIAWAAWTTWRVEALNNEVATACQQSQAAFQLAARHGDEAPILNVGTRCPVYFVRPERIASAAQK